MNPDTPVHVAVSVRAHVGSQVTRHASLVIRCREYDSKLCVTLSGNGILTRGSEPTGSSELFPSLDLVVDGIPDADAGALLAAVDAAGAFLSHFEDAIRHFLREGVPSE